MGKDWEFVILVFGGLVAAVFLLPALLPELAAAAIAKLLSWQVVVPSAEALVSIPATGVGFDLPRLLVGVGVLLLVVCAGRVFMTRGAQA
ncbi:hypothetical protein [Brachybacterium alimentarium]|uniref:hypothetical protein n=1 Tax=Brachybacterium alimentarium TaxID=47845 RepID=UPI003FD03E97